MRTEILYSFRRCPFAIRVRWALLICEIKVELREIDLKNKPLDFLNISSSKTVPILIKKNNEIIEESLEIVLWALSKSKKKNLTSIYIPEKKKETIFRTIYENDNKFKYHLDRFKYSARFNSNEEENHFSEANKFIKKWNKLLTDNKYLFGEKPTIADWCIWPFVRQFKIACESKKKKNYFDSPILKWAEHFENHKDFKYLMHKYDLWETSAKKNYFPIN
tara:strand:- start:1440 stop:2099 length:660 start_codon:yes stop_codon:yes gene_type:complete